MKKQKKHGRMKMSKELINPTDEELCDLMCGEPEDEIVDNVNHPKHYADSCSIECIDAMVLAWGFEKVAIYCQINAFKYLWRWKNKNGEEDLDKAEWYIARSDVLNMQGSNDKEIADRNIQLIDMLGKARDEM